MTLSNYYCFIREKCTSDVAEQLSFCDILTVAGIKWKIKVIIAFVPGIQVCGTWIKCHLAAQLVFLISNLRRFLFLVYEDIFTLCDIYTAMASFCLDGGWASAMARLDLADPRSRSEWSSSVWKNKWTSTWIEYWWFWNSYHPKYY